MKPVPPKCYACDAPAAGHALRDSDGLFEEIDGRWLLTEKGEAAREALLAD